MNMQAAADFTWFRERAGFDIPVVGPALTKDDWCTLTGSVELLEQRISELEFGVTEALRVLHRTNMSKRDVADYLRALIGLKSGERVPKARVG